MATRARRRLRFVLTFAALFALLWFFWDAPPVYPLKIFVVLLHEISHAAMALATGGSVLRIELDPGQGGACHCPGGNAFLTLSAGYLGSLAWGGAMFTAAHSRRVRSDRVNFWIGVLMLVLTAVYVRGLFGFAFGILFALSLIGIAQRLGPAVNRGVLFGLGLTSALYAVLDIKSDVLDRPWLLSDAAMLAEITGVPTVFWGVLWIGAALATSAWLVHRAYRTA